MTHQGTLDERRRPVREPGHPRHHGGGRGLSRRHLPRPPDPGQILVTDPVIAAAARPRFGCGVVQPALMRTQQ